MCLSASAPVCEGVWLSQAECPPSVNGKGEAAKAQADPAHTHVPGPTLAAQA
jgi:hypothetical protein